MDKKKLIPPMIMLLSGAITIILMALGGYELTRILVTLLLVMLFFYFLACILKNILDKIQVQNEEVALDEGEVIEKQSEGEEGAPQQAAEAVEKDTEDE